MKAAGRACSFLIAALAGVLLSADPTLAHGVRSAIGRRGGVSPAIGPNLVTNPGFDTDLAGWTPSGAVWGSSDANSSVTSGSARLQAVAQPAQCTGNVTIRQCVAVDQPAYDFKAMLQGGRGLLGVSATFHEGTDCTGPALPEASVGYSLFFADSRWVPYTSRLVRPPSARSLEIGALAFTCSNCSLPNPVCLGVMDVGIDDVSLAVAPPPVPARFYTLEPCRLLDTRETDEPLWDNGVDQPERRVPTAGRCGIPSSATALALNLTATAATSAGDLRLYMPGIAPLTSTLNYAAGQTRANGAVATLGVDGWLLVRADGGGKVHVIIDVVGYFE